MQVEITQVAADVALNTKHLHSSHVVCRVDPRLSVPHEFEVVDVEPGPYSPEAVLPQNDISEQEKRDLFWEMCCSHNCDNMVLYLAQAFQEISARGITLLHEGRHVQNLLIMNTLAMDVRDLLPTQAILVDKETGSQVPVFSTYENSRKLHRLLKTDPDVCKRLKRFPPDSGELNADADGHMSFEHCKAVGQGDVVPHWWLAACVEGERMVHVDLCGPAYGVFDYREAVDLVTSLKGLAPVQVFETDKFCCTLPMTKHEQERFPHKFLLTSSVASGAVRHLPEEVRHFRLVQSGVPVQVTPLTSFIDRRTRKLATSGWPSFQTLAQGLADELFKRAPPGVGIQTRDLARADLCDKVGRIVVPDLAADGGLRVAVLLQGCVKSVLVMPSKLSVFPAPQRQHIKVEDMRQQIAWEMEHQFPPGSSVKIHGLKTASHLNGLIGKVAGLGHNGVSFEQQRLPVKIDGDHKSIHINNLMKHIVMDSTSSPSEITAAQEYLNSDPVGIQLMMHLRSGNTGFTTIADPSLRPAVKQFMRALPSKERAEDTQAMLEIAEHPKGETVRQLVLKMKQGISQADLNDAMSDPEIAELYGRLVELGCVRPRS